MKIIQKICDRCKQPISFSDDLLELAIEKDYPGKDICAECDIDLKMLAAAQKYASIEGISVKESLARFIRDYEEYQPAKLDTEKLMTDRSIISGSSSTYSSNDE